MKWIFYLAALGAALLVPVDRSDVGELQPIEVVSLSVKREEVVIKTDTGDLGSGVSVDAALQNLKETTPGIVYLDTAEYLLVNADAKALIPDISRCLKDKVKVCYMDGEPDLKMAASYLAVHSPKETLGSWNEQTELEILSWNSERFNLKNK